MATYSAANLLAGLLNSGEYSDLTLVCESQEIPVHKNVVCTQSVVIDRCMKGGFEEAKSGRLEVNFDLDSCRRMVNFLYTGHYDLKASGSDDVSIAKTDIPAQEDTQEDSAPVREDAASTHGDDAAREDTADRKSAADQEELDHGSETSGRFAQLSSEELMSFERSLAHVRMNAIADYYNISSLRVFALQKAATELATNWSATVFMRVVSDAFDITNDKYLFEMAAGLAVAHMQELLVLEEFHDLDWPRHFTLQLLRAGERKTLHEQAKLCESVESCLEGLKIRCSTCSPRCQGMVKKTTRGRTKYVLLHGKPNPNSFWG
ncbi:hypothetical protein F4780DRAFT_650869 [Xylariomycetidae sp. FL0641]|nr:hypothetical protein F4780DRAFT_650869 [Xylariomycetidae sp. FL0641]